MSILKDLLKGVFSIKTPSAIQQTLGYHIGERVEYIDRAITPIHYGTITRTWEDKVKVTFDGFENGTWLEAEEIRRPERC